MEVDKGSRLNYCQHISFIINRLLIKLLFPVLKSPNLFDFYWCSTLKGINQINFNIIFATILQSQALSSSPLSESAKHFSPLHLKTTILTRISVFHNLSSTGIYLQPPHSSQSAVLGKDLRVLPLASTWCYKDILYWKEKNQHHFRPTKGWIT